MLALLPLLTLLVSVHSECTKGFMDYELLKQKASQIPNSGGDAGSLSNKGLGDSVFSSDYAMPNLQFTCSGVITGFLLGVDIRIHGPNALYPQIRLLSGNSYSLVSEREININAADFSTSGLYNYTLSETLQFSSGQILGAYHPASTASRVTLYYQTLTGQNIYRTGVHDLEDSDILNSRLLVYPLTDKPECLSGFISPEDLQVQARYVTIVDGMYSSVFGPNRLYEDIGFTCNGYITKVVVGAEDNTASTTNPPEIRIYRSNGIGGYAQTGPVIKLYYNDATSDVSTQYLRWYNLSEPVSVLDGDILGIYHYQPISQADSVIYYQRYSGPVNYYASSSVTGFNFCPLISVVAVTELPMPSSSSSTSSATSSSTSSSTSSVSDTSSTISSSTISSSSSTMTVSASTTMSTAQSTSTSMTSASTPTSGHTITTIAAVSSLSTTIEQSIYITGSVSNSSPTTTTFATTAVIPLAISSTNSDGSLVGGIIAVIIVLAIIALVAAVIIALVVVIRRRKGKGNANVTGLELDHTFSGYQQIPLKNIKPKDNPVYGADESSAALVSSTNMYEPVAFETAYTTPQDYEEMENQSPKPRINTISNAMYEATADEPAQNSLQFGVYVPTNAQRKQIMEENKEKVYEVLKDTQYPRSGKTTFFTEEPIYWDPENNTKGIYEQLAQKKYREIPRHEIKVLDHLGSGQFGTVDKGVWNTPKGQVEVAIKTLKGSANEEEKMKFLQESAINGQFRHPNVVQLCGVVTVGEPTMIVLEYISHGDLKSYLESNKPAPGQLPDSSLPTLLMTFSHQVSCGMVYLSRKRFVHRDLAARNILVASGTVCKIADFGMSRNLQNEAYYTSNNKKIPVKWTAPEAIHYSKFSTQSDVWSFGVVLYEIWSMGHKPFKKNTNHEYVGLVESGYRLPSPPGCPRSVYQIMIDSWHPVAADRPTFESISSQLSQPLTTQPGDDTLSSLGTTVYVENGCYPELQSKYL